ncbi:glycerol-3-phosphate-acyltransferase [Auriscalpium vulgare]|uniref:Glycerol-3-phosphate-acyltransferase n=1 Tax=Auriscalpium vulgare TaxID=40419 RepID=A0ACB8RUT8_9AGAM|nr:glycerol-3-phosphate-acyltransferase [Auriscalpium vulgare]
MADSQFVLHKVLRKIASWAVYSFFTEVRVLGAENVPLVGPMISTATHHNMMLDPAILSSAFPYKRILHYWAKGSLFANPVVRYILVSTGNIPVDRKSKDRQVLFRGTFDALADGAAVALFPEGTSYTEPRIMQVKDGAAWVALEYTKWAKEHPERAAQIPIVIVPSALVYTNKSKYRSSVSTLFGRPITVDPYLDQFLLEEEGAARAAAKRLTRAIESQLVALTINAPDWDTLYAARMARDLLWEDEKSLNLDDYVHVSQTLVDLFATPAATPNFNSVKRQLLEYYSLLQSAQLTNSVLSSLPLPDTLDPHREVALPSRLFTLVILIRDSLTCLIRLPFFVVPLIVHSPAYIMGRLGARLVENEEETQAQNKVLAGLLLLAFIYPAAFFFLWAFLWYTPTGAVLSASLVWLFAVYHTKLINGNYEHVKRVEAAWRVLIGVWAPKKWDYPLATLKQYTTTPIPPANPWITGSPATPKTDDKVPAAIDALAGSATDPSTTSRKRRPRSGRVMRHVLRARAVAARGLASFIDQLERAPEGKRVRASVHLAQSYGAASESNGAVVPSPDPVGWRNAKEVVQFLRERGAKVASLGRGIEGDWAALNSDGELSQAEDGEDKDDLVSVAE